MTRKRFIKLLMSRGEQRDQARAIAFLYNVSGTPYKKAYSDYLLKTSLKRVAKNLSRAFGLVGKNIQSFVQAFNILDEALMCKTVQNLEGNNKEARND